MKEVIRGFGAHMMNTQISNTNRFQSADAVGTLMNCILNTTKNKMCIRDRTLVDEEGKEYRMERQSMYQYSVTGDFSQKI